MNEQLPNNNFELITQLLDGELSSEQEAAVNQMISEDPAMQAEFDRQSEISNAIKNDDEEILPPLLAKDNVFLALGIPLAVGAPTVARFASEAGNWVSMVAAFAATVLTVTMFASLNNVDDKASATKNSTIPVVSSYERAKQNNVEVVNDNSNSQTDENLANDNSANGSGNDLNNQLNSNSNSSQNTNLSTNKSQSASSNSIRNSANRINTNSSINRNIENSNQNIVVNENSNSTINANSSKNIVPNEAQIVTLESKETVNSWSAKIVTNRNNGLNTNQSIFLEGNQLANNGLSYTRDYLTIIRTKAGSNNLNSGQFDVSFLTNYFMKDVRGIMSAGLSWYDQNSNADMRNPIYLGGGLEYTPTFTLLLDNSVFNTFMNGQLFVGRTPSYKLEAGITTTLGGLTNFPIVVGYSKTYVRDYQFIRQETNEGIFIGTEISF